jgi:predicted 3-demethylubiquinone-9 3-methyltransferase (glyoxalase superfamily)
MPSPIVPCIWLDDQAEQAAHFYTNTFPEGRIEATSHYPLSSDNPPGKPRGSVLTVEFTAAGQRFTVLNGGPMFKVNPSVSFFVNVDTVAEAERVFGVLAEGGQALMPLGTYPWSERYGWIKDRFGVSWQVMAGRRPAPDVTMVPCLMFAGANHGKAEEAIRAYTSIFARSRIEGLEHYAASEGPEETIKHGRFVLDGQTMVAMDAHGPHDFSFNEGLSLQVMCADQSELDRYWDALGEGFEKGPCGWLKDRFGLSWQVVPARIATWMASNDVPARERAFAAMMQMKKIDIAALERAFEGA